MDPENTFIHWALTEYYGTPYFSENTDFYNIIFAPAEKGYILTALNYVIESSYNSIYVGHMIPRLDEFMLKLCTDPPIMH